ncbi:MAG TPA: hypothetical protein PKN13_12095 [Accumulibacter sp.]|nr:hypothetical protein [Accumulibacter sp.]HMW18960.1 hypothetical protein [Accumulibacter sp.]HMX22059.1 hypothetical protein [Accumulibacter sp.]HMY06984.1 hypothetical protein [Accumulibacter sp.]HNC18555.1 hypothetical protein [Accumulibacter sp.]
MILPLAWQANDQLTIGGSMDYVWASVNLQMLIDGAHFGERLADQRFAEQHAGRRGVRYTMRLF